MLISRHIFLDKLRRGFFVTILLGALNSVGAADSSDIQLVQYNNPGLITDLGVGLWAWPLPMDWNKDGLINPYRHWDDMNYRFLVLLIKYLDL